jgi:hypothetical protein
MLLYTMAAAKWRPFLEFPNGPPRPIFKIDNVAKMIWEESGKDVWADADFPNVAPPFRHIRLEYTMPARANVGGKFKPNHHAGTRIGFVCRSYERGQTDLWESSLLSLGGFSTPAANLKRESAKWLTVIGGFTLLGKNHVGRFPYRTVVSIDEKGGIIPGAWVILPDCDPEKAGFKEMINIAPVIHWPLFLALSLAHCKNVRAVESPELKPTKKRLAGPPRYRHYTLEIDPMRTTLRGAGSNAGGGLIKAVHICRGHFKDYRDGSGLFGKVRGCYWWHDSVRGSASAGMVEKDYSVAAKRRG